VGGAIGYGMPCSIGAALACPDRPVINFQADGSAMYTVQSLWTMARERLNITTLVCNNGGYNIVRIELDRAGVKHPGPAARAVTDFTDPAVDWVKMAGGLGVPGVTVTTVDDLAREFGRAVTESGPHLIEVLL
jgi:acetolactate synthase-1/2/3 large subunit